MRARITRTTRRSSRSWRRSTGIHMQHFAYFLEKLRDTPDGDGSLLDHSIFVYGSGISDGNIHFHLDLPMVVVGGGAGTLKGGRHVRYKDDTPIANLYVALLDKLGAADGPVRRQHRPARLPDRHLTRIVIRDSRPARLRAGLAEPASCQPLFFALPRCQPRSPGLLLRRRSVVRQYPSPWTVWMNVGCCGSGSIFFRRRTIA